MSSGTRPAFTRDVTGGLGVAVFALEPAEVALFDREELCLCAAAPKPVARHPHRQGFERGLAAAERGRVGAPQVSPKNPKRESAREAVPEATGALAHERGGA